MGDTAARVVDAIRENRRRFEEFCRSLTPEQLARAVPDNSWSVRDFIAHVGTLDPEIARWFEAAADGRPERPRIAPDGSSFDVDSFNEAQVAERRAWPLEQVLVEAAANRARLIEALGRITDEQAEQLMYFPGDNKRDAGRLPLKLFLAGWAQHDPIHAADMLKALPERAGDARLREWLDDPFVAGYQRAMSGPPKR